MIDYALPVLYALFVWWFGTGLVLVLDGLPPRTFRWSMLAATAVLVWAFMGLAASADDATPTGGYAAFTYALLIWCWLEMSFLMGFVTGSRTDPLPAGWSGMRRFTRAVQAILYHEAAILAAGMLVLATAWSAPNPVGAWTFAVLWGMRTSAKLNLFLGVRNTAEEFLPPHLRYLASFFRRRPMNWLLPFSIAIPAAIAGALIAPALAAGASAFDITGRLLVGALLTLAIVEHAFLVLPLPATALWNWSLRSRTAPVERRP